MTTNCPAEWVAEPAHDGSDEAPFVHPRALCESDTVGRGTKIWAFAHVMKGASVGADCNICDHAFIESGAVVGDRVTVKNGAMIWNGVVIENDVFIGPGAVFTNDLYPRSRRGPAARSRSVNEWLVKTTVRQGATIGAGAVVVCGHRIGRFATVGAGAVVTRDVPDHALVVGNPARIAGWVSECGRPLDDHLRCLSCGRRYRVVDGTLQPA